MHTSPRPFSRFISTSAVLLALLAGGPALAQPVEDPGLEEGKKPPAETPTSPPPAATQPPPAQPAPPQPAPPPPAPSYTEKVDVKVEYLAADQVRDAGPKETSVEFYDRLAAVSYGGPVGLLRTLTGDAGNTHTFRVSINFGFFKADSFLIKGNSTVPGDSNSHFAGDLTISYTPWKYIEAYAALFNQSNKNERTDPGRTDPQVILSLGDFAFGLKGRYPVHKSFDLALHAGVRFLNSVSGVSFDGKSTNFAIDLIGSFDVRKIAAKVPLRFHLNFGYLLDNSINLLPDGQCGRSTGNDACIRSRVVQTFAYGIGPQRLRLALAVDAPLLLGPVGLQPFFEYHNEIALGDGDTTVERTLSNDPNVSNDRLTGRTANYLTIGARLRPVAGLIFTAAVDVGLTSFGFMYGPPTMPWNVVLGLAYAYDGMAGARVRTKQITKTITRTPTEYAPPTGRVRGIVRDANTKKPVSGVVIKYPNEAAGLTPQLTGEDGTFVSYPLRPGAVWMELSSEQYETQKTSTDVRAGAETPIEVLLAPKPPETGRVTVKPTDDAGQPLAATVRFVSSKGPVIDADLDPAGGYHSRLPAGDYTVDVTANGYLAKPRQLHLDAGQVLTIDVQLHKKPKVSRVAMGKGEIVIKGVIHFENNKADLLPDGQQLLDEVVDFMVANPQIRRVRIEGHTDNRGLPMKNVELSRARAHSVMTYLIKQGIDATRLESEGYGASQPLVPNITAANRAKNRRVAFKIIE